MGRGVRGVVCGAWCEGHGVTLQLNPQTTMGRCGVHDVDLAL